MHVVTTSSVRRATAPLLLTLLGLVLVGCGTVSHRVNLVPDYQIKPGTAFELATVSNATGQVYEVDIETLLLDALTRKLRGDQPTSVDTHSRQDPEAAPPTKVSLNCKIVEYEPGNAFKRWLLPGWGSTVLGVQCDLKDGERLVGSEDARRTVSFGGAYTIGAWRTIFETVADDMVEDLRARDRPM